MAVRRPASQAGITLIEVLAAIVGKSIPTKSGGAFKYDEALKDVSPDDKGVGFVIERWGE